MPYYNNFVGYVETEHTADKAMQEEKLM